MKPLTLEFCGINSFSEPAFIDFRELLEFGIFGVFGDTGSGKSTILDCIGFALYGRASRDNTIDELINYRRDRAYVNFEFEMLFEGRRRVFRVERSLRRRKGALGGCEHSAKVFERTESGYLTAADGTAPCQAFLSRLIGLNQEDFQKCIALPQGEFAQFVKARKADRLKIVARLFDLERYGGALGTRANAAFRAASEQAKIVETRLERYEGLSEESLSALKQELSRLEAEGNAVRADVLRAREEEKRLEALKKRAEERESLTKRLFELEAEKTGMKALSDELDRLGRAATALAAARDASEKRDAALRAERAYSDAKDIFERAKRERDSLPAFDEEGADAEIERLSAAYTAAEASQEVRARMNALGRELAERRARLAGLEKKLVPFDYEGEKRALEASRGELGAEDFLGFLETHGRSALLRGEYKNFADELLALEQKYPEIAGDTEPLIGRYQALSEGEKASFADLKRLFEARERAREAADRALAALNERHTSYGVALEQANSLRAEIDRLEREAAECAKKLEGAEAPDVLKRRLAEKREEKRQALEKRRRAEEGVNRASPALAAAEERANGARLSRKEAEERLSQALEAGPFSSGEEARALLAKYGNADEARARVEGYREEYAAVRRRLRELSSEETYSAEAHRTVSETLSALEARERKLANGLAVGRERCAADEKRLLEKGELEREFAERKREADLAETLKKLLGDNKFIEFVSEEYLQTIAANASARLLSLTGGRYFLRYDGGFCVGDNFDGGAFRGVNTLSGGETFLVSLSLALSLSEEICRKSLRPIEFFFLDEGFGTLDSHLVDVVMDSLEKLKGEHFAIGLISHVEELKHRIERRIVVTKATETCGSKIKTE